MAVGLQAPGALPVISGVTLSVGSAGIRSKDRPDLAVILCDAGTQAAACFTRNRFQAAPVVVARRHLAAGTGVRALVVNSGNANAGTGEEGLEDARAVCRAVAGRVGVSETEVLPFSTGIIGQRLPAAKIIAALPKALETREADGWLRAAGAIMTTDTLPKGGSRRVTIDGSHVTITGIAKGSGMICPDMATMLCFLATDAAIPARRLEDCLNHAVERSFNRITVDGDTSTNDACVLLATGKGTDIPDGRMEGFQAALDDLCLELAQSIVRDGEGATKFVEVAVNGAASDADALSVARTVAHSPLVKTALSASDANWGRIVAAVGRAPVRSLDIGRLALTINGCSVLRAGAVDPRYEEERGMAAMAAEEIVIAIDLGIGAGRGSVWTCDLSHDYVRINADYRT
ncbi:MAG: bifunctional glutamate N-acetyltransferase/amino-acid acetyltransferase ArgJ [Arenicellales bacterium]